MPTNWEEFREPFAGGLSLSLRLMQLFPERRYWVNDLDPFVSCFWSVLATQPEQLVKTLNHCLLEYPTDDNKRSLCEWAKRMIHEVQGVDRAAFFFIMSKTSFSGFAFGGSCTHPWRFNNAAIESLAAVGRLLRTVKLKVTDLDYADCLSDAPNVFTYFDPPYLLDTFLYGAKGEMHRNFDHRRFAKTVSPIKSPWMLSYNNDLLIRSYFKAHHVSTIQIQYTSREKRKETELLITNYEN
jgi:DNA adenine methylase